MIVEDPVDENENEEEQEEIVEEQNPMIGEDNVNLLDIMQNVVEDNANLHNEQPNF